MIQTILCFFIVLAALLYLFYYYFSRSKKKSCGGCDDCGRDLGMTKKNKIISIPLSTLQRRSRKK